MSIHRIERAEEREQHQAAGAALGIGRFTGSACSRWRRYSRPRINTSPNQPTDSATLRVVKCVVRAPIAPPSQTPAADNTSPTRTRKVSITAFALYFASRDTTRNSEFPAVLWRE